MLNFRKTLNVTVAVMTTWGTLPSGTAQAACAAAAGAGSGPPAISATEVSTSQALQFLRKRQDEVQNPVQVASNTPSQAPAQDSPPPKQVATPTPPPAPKVAVAKAPTAPVAKEPAAPSPKSVADAKPATPATKPAEPPKSVADAKPAEPAKPVDPSKSATADTSKPADPSKPATADAGKPADAAKPVDPSKPATADAGKPDTTGKPSASAKPDVADAMKPAPSKPMITAEKPAPKVSMAAKPTKSIVVAEKAEPVREVQPSGRAPAGYVSMKDTPQVIEAPEPTRGFFGQAYYDHERHTGWTLGGGDKGQLRTSSDTGGLIAGADAVVGRGTGSSKVLLGVLGGITETSTSYNNARFIDPTATSATAATDVYLSSSASQNVSGGGGGIYALLVSDRFSASALFQVDGYTTEQRDNVSQIAGCGVVQDLGSRSGRVDSTVYTLSANASYRYELGSVSTWFEPMVGVRYTHADYGTNKGALNLGYIDGDAFRIQGGARLGHLYDLGSNGVVVTTLTGLLYSDVSISGFTERDINGISNAKVDEGKLRVLGQLQTAWSKPDGLTYLLTGEIRGGDQVIGYGAKAGFRFDW